MGGWRALSRRDVLRNARELEKYLEVLLPRLEPSGGIPDVPYSRKERGGSRPPVSTHVMRLWMSNPHLDRIHGVLKKAAMATDDVKLEGRPLWHIASDCLFDHTAIRRWKHEGGVEEKRFYMMCMLLAQHLADKYDQPDEPYIIRVYIDPNDEQERQKTREAQKADTHYTQRRMIEQLEEVEEETGYGGVEAMEILSDRKKREGKDWSVRKLRDARTYVNKMRVEGVASGG
jgi:hypothetical protein